jgi:transcription antitermination factor NusG
VGHFPKARALRACPLQDIAFDNGATPEAAFPAARALKSWFAVFTYPRHEKRVAEQCVSYGLEALLPLYRVKRRWKNRQTVTLEMPVFPNYLFVKLDTTERTPVLGLRGVAGIVGGLGSSIPESYMEALRTGTELGRIFPHRDPIVGEKVRIVSGPLAGVEGVLTQVRSELRVALSIEMIRQSVSIEVSREEIVLVAAMGGKRSLA